VTAESRRVIECAVEQGELLRAATIGCSRIYVLVLLARGPARVDRRRRDRCIQPESEVRSGQLDAYQKRRFRMSLRFPRGLSQAAPRAALGLWLAVLGWCGLHVAGCGTALLATRVPYSETGVAQLRAAGAARGCHEQPSQIFRLFLACPGRDQALGVSVEQDKFAITCPHLQHRGCRKLFESLRVDPGAQRAATQGSASAGSAAGDGR
jgi:hypothetical protein